MSSKRPCSCPICLCPGLINLNQLLNGIRGQERKQLIQRATVETKVMTTEPQSHIRKHIVFSLSNKKKWMLEYSKILCNIISPALKEWKRKVIRI